MPREEVTLTDGSAQVDSNEDAAPVVAPRPPPMTTQQIAAYRSGEDPDFDPVERRGWWEVDLTSGWCTMQMLPAPAVVVLHCIVYSQLLAPNQVPALSPRLLDCQHACTVLLSLKT